MPSAAVAAAIEVVLFTGEAILLARELVIPFPITYHVPRVAALGRKQRYHPDPCVAFAGARIEPTLSLRRHPGRSVSDPPPQLGVILALGAKFFAHRSQCRQIIARGRREDRDDRLHRRGRRRVRFLPSGPDPVCTEPPWAAVSGAAAGSAETDDERPSLMTALDPKREFGEPTSRYRSFSVRRPDQGARNDR